MVTGSTRGAPVHPLAWAAIATAVLAGVLALYGSMHAEKHMAGSPLREARGDATARPPGTWAERQLARADRLDARVRAATADSKIVNYTLQLVAFVLPFALGVGAALAGGSVMSAVQRFDGRYVGNTLAVFAMLVGGLAAVVAGCMMLTLYVWPRLPSPYTT